ncbi:MAG: hypothetical protein RBR53_00510 [Desulforegulaceae bacterium]|nr:hypothetical protein [Desulforegulaceae bacterium]
MFKLFPFESDAIRMRVYFDAESKPQSFSKDEDCFIEGWFSLENLLVVADSLQDELNKYPSRK